MVKTLHPIDDIAASVSLADEHRVRLTRESDVPQAVTDGQDPVAAVIRALTEPLEYPPLSASTVPGDRVAIALVDAVPYAAGIVQGMVEALQRAGVEPEAISIVTTDAETARTCREELSDKLARMPIFVVHDPDDDDNLCLIGVTKRHEPLLINRTIFDADIVLPVGVARVNESGGHDSLFPWFSNAAAIGRHRTPANATSATSIDERAHEAKEAGWLIGVPMVIQVVPGPGETVAQVVAGEPQAIARRCEELCRQRWSLHSRQHVDLVIATITGGPQSQTWANVGRALVNAEQLLTDEGAVAICSNLDVPPGESLGRLIGSTDLEKTERKIGHDHGEDSWPAWQLARALRRGPVYFLSQLAAETVEDMGLAPIADIAELARLASRHDSFVLIEDSQHAVVTVDEDYE
ncbi:MAG: lactate racemase domain-containing protein [Pirellulales bacterium]